MNDNNEVMVPIGDSDENNFSESDFLPTTNESTLEYVLTGKHTDHFPDVESPVLLDTVKLPDIYGFLHLLYRNCPDGYLTVTTLDPTVSYHFPASNLEQAAEAIERYGKHQNTYLGMCLRQGGLNAAQRGTINQLKYMTCLWADVDVLSDAHAEKALPQSMAEARRFLLCSAMVPSIIINSGHGLYGIWLFEEPIDISTDEGQAFAAQLSDGFGIYLNRSARNHNWKLDTVSDLPRMLRAPGTTNFKATPVPSFIEAITRSSTVKDAPNSTESQPRAESELHSKNRRIVRYSRDLLNVFAFYGRPDEPSQTFDIKHGQLGSAERLQQCPFIQHCIEDAEELSEPEWHTMMSIVSLCEDGDEKVHDWSEAYPDYSQEETGARYARALRENKPCSCRYIRSRFPGICPTKGCYTSSGYKVRGPITFALFTDEERIDNLLNGRVSIEDILSDANLSLATYAQQSDTRRYALLKEKAYKAGVSKRDYDKIVSEQQQKKAQEKDTIPKERSPHRGPLTLEGIDAGNLVVPSDWDVTMDGIDEVHRDSRGREYTSPVSPAPVFISELFEDIDSGIVRLDLVFRSLGRWKHALVTRDFAMNRGKIITLAETGFPVVSDTTGGMTRYLRDFEAVNIKLLPIKQSVARLGWKGDEFFPYYTDKPVTFIHEDVDRLKLIEAFHTQGNYGAWKTLAGKMRTTPVARAMLAVSFAAPLVEKLKRRSILLYVWFYSGAGKTAMLKTAISVWGDPDALMGDFNTTEPGLERKASALCNLPVGIDELQALDREKFSPEDLIYLLANGHGKTKANDKDSTKTMAKWRTSFIMTGEVEMINEKSPDGAHNRLISLNGRVIENSVVGSIVHEVSEKNYGWAGQEYIKYLVDEVIKVEVPVRDVERLESIAGQPTLTTSDGANDATLTAGAKLGASETAGASQAAPDAAYDATQADAPADGLAMLLAAKNARAVGANGAAAIDATQTTEANDSVWANLVQVNREVEGEGQVSKLNADFNHMRNRVTRIARERGLVIGAHTDQLTMIALGDMYASISVFKMDPATAEEEAVHLVSDMLTMMNLNAKVDVVDNAWNHLTQWVTSNKRTFMTEKGESLGGGVYAPNVPISGVFNNDRTVSILTTVANKVLEDGGYDHRKSFQGFKERGYIKTSVDSKGHTRIQMKKRINGIDQQRVYILKMDVSSDDEDERGILE